MRLVRSIDRPPEDRDAVHPTTNPSHIRISPKRGVVMKTPLPQDTRHPENAKSGPVLQQYAALPWRMNRDGFLEVLLVTSRRRGRWTVPKGWQVKHRSASQSAETEAFEEAGVIGQVGSEPIGSYLYSKRRDDGSFESRSVTIFGLHVQGTLHNWPEKSARKRRWMPVIEACGAVGEPTLAEFLRALRSKPLDPSAADAGSTSVSLGRRPRT